MCLDSRGPLTCLCCELHGGKHVVVRYFLSHFGTISDTEQAPDASQNVRTGRVPRVDRQPPGAMDDASTVGRIRDVLEMRVVLVGRILNSVGHRQSPFGQPAHEEQNLLRRPVVANYSSRGSNSSGRYV